jgi:UDP-glucose:(heptosyl)LPS alpha-1,3-glucosyltransferase
MRVAIGIVDLFAGGGLQRDCLEICAALRRRSHEVALYCAQGEYELVQEFHARVLPVRSLTNHGRDTGFGQAFIQASLDNCDVRVGFNKMPGLDVLYCADRCFAARPARAWNTFLPRHWARRSLEAACFGPEADTVALMLSRAAVDEYRKAWETPPERLKLLPPTVARSRVRPKLLHDGTRTRVRTVLGIPYTDLVWLFVGVQPHTKGLDRAFDALASVPGARLLVAGTNGDVLRKKPLNQWSGRPAAAERMICLGHREDIPELMAASDVLVHPARYDMTGQVILEALTVGLPVVTTAACGFAEHVVLANAGIVLPEPFDARAFGEALAQARSEDARRAWSRAALAYCAGRDFTLGHEIAADCIEQIAVRAADQ